MKFSSIDLSRLQFDGDDMSKCLVEKFGRNADVGSHCLDIEADRVMVTGRSTGGAVPK